uniref:Uncharacterized protein n=1 Tax=Arundo donax TaxID=35708 RepID=A0A0A9A9A4_ARUDO
MQSSRSTTRKEPSSRSGVAARKQG